MSRPVDLACFDARYLALLRRFPNQVIANSCLVMPAPDADGALVFAASHNHHYLLFHDAAGFSNGIYEFGVNEDFFEAISLQHMPGGSVEAGLRLALSNVEYRLYRGTENHRLYEPSADAEIVFTWSARIARAQPDLRDAFDAILYLHQSGNSVPVKQALSGTYFSEISYIRSQLAKHSPISVSHRWIRLPDNSVRCLTQFNAASPEPAHVHALVCVDADMALG
ncbi:MAG: hypothetical protein V2J89_05805 [Halieaceae bacterium]|nr:hypothetical protein [Halieaceae bacterium]